MKRVMASPRRGRTAPSRCSISSRSACSATRWCPRTTMPFCTTRRPSESSRSTETLIPPPRSMPSPEKRVGDIDLGAGPEFGVSAGDGKLFVNLEDKNAVAELDAAGMRVKRQWSLAPCESPTGLAIDRAHHLLFSGCRNKLMAISDATNGALVTTVQIGQGVDACRFDPGTQLAFASNGDGTLTVIHEDTPGKFTVVANVPTKRGARTMELDL